MRLASFAGILPISALIAIWVASVNEPLPVESAALTTASSFQVGGRLHLGTMARHINGRQCRLLLLPGCSTCAASGIDANVIRTLANKAGSDLLIVAPLEPEHWRTLLASKGLRWVKLLGADVHPELRNKIVRLRSPVIVTVLLNGTIIESRPLPRSEEARKD